MSVKTEIDRLKQNVANAYAVLDAMGCDMPSEQNSDNLASTAGTSKVVRYDAQTLTDEQKAQARNNIGATTQDYVDSEITNLKAQGVQQTPLFANSIEECVDTSKVYVLPDGYIYAYMYSDAPSYTNLALPLSDEWKSGYRINASGALATSTETGAFASNIFECKKGDVIRIKCVKGTAKTSGTSAYFVFLPLKSDGSNVSNARFYLVDPPTSVESGTRCVGNQVNITEDGVYEYTLILNQQGSQHADSSSMAKGRIAGILTGNADDVIITINEEIGSASGYQWTNTGRAFVPTDYEDRIITLERNKTVVDEKISLIEKELAEKEDASTGNIKWCAMGDSITQGYVSYMNGDSPTSKVDSANSWTTKVAELTGWGLTNKAIGGTGYINLENSDTQGTTGAWYVARNTDFAPFNLVTLWYGVNDWKGNEPLGTINDAITTPSTIYSGMKATIEAIMESNPLCKIVVITPLNCAGYNFDYGTEATNWGLSKSFSNNGTLETIFDAIVDVCEYYGIDYVDMTHKSVVNRKNILDCLTDGVHPNAETHTLLAYELAKKIQVI